MNKRLRFFRSCVMALGLVLAMACGHGLSLGGLHERRTVGSSLQFLSGCGVISKAIP